MVGFFGCVFGVVGFNVDVLLWGGVELGNFGGFWGYYDCDWFYCYCVFVVLGVFV